MDASRQHWRRALPLVVALIKSSVIVSGALLAASWLLPVLERAGGWGDVAVGPSRIADFRDRLADPLSYFLRRSPGARRPVGPLQTRHARSAHPAVKPFERVLSNVRYGPATSADALPDYLDGLVAGPNPSLQVVDLPDAQIALSPAAGDLTVPTIPVLVWGRPVAPTPNSPIPEPSAWATLIMGLIVIGIRLRCRRRYAGKGANKATGPET